MANIRKRHVKKKLTFILKGFRHYYYVDPAINYLPNFPNNSPPPISGPMFGRQQLNSENSVLLDLQELLGEILDRPRENLRQRRRTVRQHGNGVDLCMSLEVKFTSVLFGTYR